MKQFIKTLLLLGLLCCSMMCSAKNRPPNILFILVDDMGVRDLQCYGSDYYRTPHLDRLAAEGMRFTRAYASASVCSPTRASILTGLSPHRMHLTDALPWDRLYQNSKMIPPNHLKELPSKLPNFAQTLQAAGYRTALFGKWHLGNEKHFFTDGQYASYGFDEAKDCSGKAKKYDKGVDVLTQYTVRFLKANKDRPFMLCLMHHVPHVPIACPPEAQALYDDVPKGIHQKNKKYAGMISHLDQSIQTILDQLASLDLEDNTVVIFTSDNGGLDNKSSNKPWRGGKGGLYEGGLRVPLIVRWPEQIAPDTVCDSAVISTDYFPTFLELAGQSLMPQSHVDGESMLPLWLGDRVASRTLYWHFPHRDKPSSSVIDGNWKLMHNIMSDQYELFDLDADPEEAHDLSLAHPEHLDRLAKMLQAHLQDSAAQRMRPNPQWDSSRPTGKLTNYGTFIPPVVESLSSLQRSPFLIGFMRMNNLVSDLSVDILLSLSGSVYLL